MYMYAKDAYLDEVDRNAPAAEAPGAADPVQVRVRIRLLREAQERDVVVHHQRHGRDVHPPGENVRGQQHLPNVLGVRFCVISDIC